MAKDLRRPNGDKMIGSRVKELRLTNSLTQKQLADEVMVSPSSIARLETGESMVSVYTMIRIAEVLRVPTSAILMENSQGENVREDLRIIDTILETCTLDERRKIIRLIEYGLRLFFLNDNSRTKQKGLEDKMKNSFK